MAPLHSCTPSPVSPRLARALSHRAKVCLLPYLQAWHAAAGAGYTQLTAHAGAGAEEIVIELDSSPSQQLGLQSPPLPRARRDLQLASVADFVPVPTGPRGVMQQSGAAFFTESRPAAGAAAAAGVSRGSFISQARLALGLLLSCGRAGLRCCCMQGPDGRGGRTTALKARQPFGSSGSSLLVGGAGAGAVNVLVTASALPHICTACGVACSAAELTVGMLQGNAKRPGPPAIRPGRPSKKAAGSETGLKIMHFFPRG